MPTIELSGPDARSHDAALFDRYRAGDLTARETLLRRHMALARRLARRHRGPSDHREDLDQLAYLALLKAIDRFEPGSGAFVAYAVVTIRGELSHYSRDRLVRDELSTDISLTGEEDDAATLGETLGAEDGAYAGCDWRLTLRPLIDKLPFRERQVLGMRFFGDLHQAEIGQHLGISQMHVSRLIRRSLATLQSSLTT